MPLSETYIMQKVTIFTERKYDFVGKKGEQITGTMYGAFLANGRAIEFSSNTSHKVYEGNVGFNPDQSEDVDIVTKIFDGKLKYAEKNPLG